MILYEALKPFFHILKVTSGFVAKTLIATKKGILLQLFPILWLFLPWGTLKRISSHIMICQWEFRFFDLLMAISRLFGVLILIESVGQAKWQRNLGFGTYFLFIISYWLQLRFFENLANQAAMDRIKSKFSVIPYILTYLSESGPLQFDGLVF